VVPILFTCGADKIGKIMIYLVSLVSFFWKVLFVIFTRNKQHTEQRKRETLSGLLLA